MRIAFLGTPDLAAVCLRALLARADTHPVVCVVTQPDRPVGRHRAPQSPPVKEVAIAAGLPVMQPETLRGAEVRDRLAASGAQVGVTVAYGRILGPRLLACLPLGFINAHASLLPRWRGASPIQAAIRAGDDRSGVTIMQMDEGLDTGAMLLWRELELSARETSETLTDRLARLAAELLPEALDGIAAGAFTPLPQAASPFGPPTVCRTLRKEDGAIDWRLRAVEIDRQVRALALWPGAYSSLDGERFLIREAVPAEPGAARARALPGQVWREGNRLLVACGEGILELLVVQRAGKRAATAADLLRGYALPSEACFQ